MGIFRDWLKGPEARTQKPDKPEVGISRAPRGNIGLWAVWNEERYLTEVHRVVVKAQNEQKHQTETAFSYTFGPARTRSFVQFVEVPWFFKEFLRGRERAREGSVTFEFIFADHRNISKTVELSKVLKCYRGEGPDAPTAVMAVTGTMDCDSPEIAEIPTSGLRAYSEKIKAELEEKRRKAEEEAARQEALRLEAEKKAAEAKAKAAAEAAAKAATGGGGAKSAASDDPNTPTLSGGKVGIFYGTSTGNTGNVAAMIKEELGAVADHCKAITEIKPIDLTVPEILIIGIPTWHIGEMQDDWTAIYPQFKELNFAGKKVCFFGLGDGKGYPDTYVDAMQDLWEPMEKKGAKLFGLWPTEGYEFKKSRAIKDGKFLGVVIDVENQDQLTSERVKAWVSQIRKELGI